MSPHLPTEEQCRSAVDVVMDTYITELLAVPGRWLKCPLAIAECPPTLHEVVDGIEIFGLRRPDGLVDIYGRWLGDPSTHPITKESCP